VADIGSVDGLKITFLVGCTGCGKGALGRELATRIHGEIISVDSMKVYRRMDIGTAKPGVEARDRVRHHLIDVVDPSDEFSVANFVQLAEAAAADIAGRGKEILAVGGTGLYIKSLSEGLFDGPSSDEAIRSRLHDRADREGTVALHAELARVDGEAADRIHRNDLRRIVRALEVYELTGKPITALQTQWDQTKLKHACRFIGVRRSLDDQNHRTNLRVRRLIERGWVDEVRALMQEQPPVSGTAWKALGYPELLASVKGEIALADAVEKIKISTRQFAKAQRTWFKRFPKTQWFDLEPDDDPGELADRILNAWDAPCSTQPK